MNILNKLLRFSVDSDPTIQEAAQEAITKFVQIFRECLNQVLNFVILTLSSKSASEHQVKGAMSLLSIGELRNYVREII